MRRQKRRQGKANLNKEIRAKGRGGKDEENVANKREEEKGEDEKITERGRRTERKILVLAVMSCVVAHGFGIVFFRSYGAILSWMSAA